MNYGYSVLLRDAVNPGRETLELKLDAKYDVVYTIGEPTVNGDTLAMSSQSFIVLKPVK